MNSEPLISIVMPVYQVQKYISDSVQSVMNQSYTNIELILVDDGSRDQSIAVAEELLSGCKLKYEIIHQENAGLGYARNAGLKKAQGEWVCFLDADDMITSNGIEHLVHATTLKDVDMVFSDFKEIKSAKEVCDKNEIGVISFYSSQELQWNFLKRTLVILAPGTLYKKQVLMDHKLFFEKIPWSEDQQFIWRVLHDINNAAYVDEPIYQYLQHGGSIMKATKGDKIIESYDVICKLPEYYRDNDAIGKYIIPRWVMGTMNSVSITMRYVDWKGLWLQLRGKNNFRLLFGFPNLKVRILAFIGWLFPGLYYFLIKGVKKAC